MRESIRRLASQSEEERHDERRGEQRRVRIELLDGDFITLQVHRGALGSDLLTAVCASLDLTEPDYFGLLHAMRGDPRVWINDQTKLSHTFRNEPWEARLAVRFYPPQPSELRDDSTRFQLALAVRRDLMEGRLTCSPITHALLGSYILQAELGDYEEAHLKPHVLAGHSVAPPSVLNDELVDKMRELYRKHKGQTPAEAELNYLENAKKLSLYGCELHCAMDSDGVDIIVAVGGGGVTVFRDGLLMNRFPWAKISKISYNKRVYTLKLRASEFDQFETHLGFRLANTAACKKLWRCSVEHHMFFRRPSPVAVPLVSALPRLGSRRLSCRRTLTQLRDTPAVAVRG